ncbi:MAG: helix-turn-helix transcriptional regulator [Syntrophorhabdaceae bacterium]
MWDPGRSGRGIRLRRPQRRGDDILSTLPNKDLFRLNEVASYLDVSKSTLYRWISEGVPGAGDLQVVKVGKGLRIRRSEIIRIQKNRS